MSDGMDAPSREFIHFFVPGIPAPGGSKRAFLHRHTGKIIVKDDAKRNAPWRAVAALEARRAMNLAGQVPTDEPLRVLVTFVLPRPRGHYGTGRKAGVLKASAPPFPARKPDATKLWRALEDALTGIVWVDDSRIVSQAVDKVYGDQPGAVVSVYVARAGRGAA